MWVTGRRAVAEAIRAGLATEVLVADSAHATGGLRDVLEASATSALRIRRVARHDLDRYGPDHQGVVALVRIPEPLGERGLVELPFGPDAVVVALDGITDPHNLGASARVADAAGAAALVVRERRAAGVTPSAVRASAGALLHLPLARVANVHRTLERLKDAGFTVVGLDDAAERSAFEAAPPAGRVAVVVGSEGEGMARLTREACDLLVRLPMAGKVRSMNASTALAAALFAFVLPGRQGGAGGDER